jgi:hypothetical protein
MLLAIGQQHYSDPYAPDLAGPIPDALAMAQLFKESKTALDLPKSQIIETILAVKPAVLYWSGHGIRARVRGGYKEGLVCPSERGQGYGVLWDSEFRDLLQQAEVEVVLIDTCHSGGATRSGDRVRSFSISRSRTNRLPKVLGDMARSEDYALKAYGLACQASQVAYEVPYGEASRGVFTLALEYLLPSRTLNYTNMAYAMKGVNYSARQTPILNGVTDYIKTRYDDLLKEK